jgi:putative hydrolase of the HAD superfamily
VPLPVVFFDLDDTLFDHTWSMRASIEALRTEFPIVGAMPLERVEAIYIDALESLHLRVLAGALSIEDARRLRLERILGAAGDPGGKARVARAVDVQRDSYQDARRAVPGSRALLQALRDRARIGIVTNNLRDEQVDKLAVIGLSDLVDDMVTSGELGISKPDPAIFEVALSRIAGQADRAVMVGDSWRSDIEGAHAAGVRAVWFNRHHPLRDDPEVPELSSWDPVERVVEQLVQMASGA